MIIVADSNDAQEVKFIPRELYTGTGFANFTDKQTKETFEYEVTLVVDRYYNYFSEAMADLIEGHNYDVSIGYGATEIYSALALCTNQSTYSVHNGDFTERTTVNDYVIYE